MSKLVDLLEDFVFCNINRRALTDRRGEGILCNLNKGFNDFLCCRPTRVAK